MLRIDLQTDIGYSSRGGPLQRVLSSRALELLRDPAVAGAILLSITAMVLGGWVNHKLNLQLDVAREAVEVESQEATRLKEDLRRTQELSERRAKVEGLIAQIGGIDRNRYAYVLLMDQVAAAIPSNVWVEAIFSNSLNEQTGNVDFRLHGFAPGVDQVSIFMQQLEMSPFLNGITYINATPEKLGASDVVRFELSGTTTLPDEAFLEMVRMTVEGTAPVAMQAPAAAEDLPPEEGTTDRPPANAPPIPGSPVGEPGKAAPSGSPAPPVSRDSIPAPRRPTG
jgi:Tfp pilus assembly protein PilN